jgi:hypothetical protein
MPNENALAQAMQQDRTFFELNPDMTEYRRWAIQGEDFGFFPPQTLVHVVNYGKGMRSRTFYLPPEEIGADLVQEFAAEEG